MIVYQNKLSDFINDVVLNSISDKLVETLRKNHITGSGSGEINSWNNSLHFMRDVLDYEGMPYDCETSIEYNNHKLPSELIS